MKAGAALVITMTSIKLAVIKDYKSAFDAI